MPKESGIGMTLTVNSNNIANDVKSLDVATPREVQDVTGLDKSAIERLLLLADASVDLNGVFNDASSMSHATLKTAATASAGVVVAIGLSGQTLSMTMMQTDYALSRGDDGAATWKAPFVLSSGTAPAWS